MSGLSSGLELLLSWSLLFITCHMEPCAKFNFPSIQNDTLVVRENNIVNITFEIQVENCPGAGPFVIKVDKVEKSSVQPSTLCSLLCERGTCLHSGHCEEKPEYYMLSVTFHRNDYALRLEGPGESVEIILDVHYPPTVTSLEVNGASSNIHEAETDTPIKIACAWDEGNPPVKARLLDRQRVEMEGSINSTGQIRYTFPAVGCQDAGLIRCEAPGASQNLTVRLLVRCAPEFQTNATIIPVHAVPSEDVEVKFPFRSHSTQVKDCQLVKGTSHTSDNDEHVEDSVCMEAVDVLDANCTRLSNVTGTPPDLTLTVRLDNASTEDEGRWCLELTNEIGVGYVHFLISFEELPPHCPNNQHGDCGHATERKDHTGPFSDGTPLSFVITVSVAVLVGVVLIIVITVVLVKRVLVQRARKLRLRSGEEAIKMKEQNVGRARHHSSGSEMSACL